jgi:hypothetical protein
MDYYQKYQKYKFKYLNLLNQSGGYTPEEFKQMLENKEDEDFLEDEDIDFLTHDQIKVKNAVLIDTRVYDVNSLFEWINIKYNENKIAKDPLTNNELKLQHFVDIKNKLFDEEKKNIIKKIIVKIIINDQEQFDKINFLNEYYIIWIQAIKLNWHVFKNIPVNDPEITNEQYIEICELAVKQHSNALEFVKANAMKDEQYLEICKLAFRHKAFNTLKYVPNLKRTFKICELAVKQNYKTLENVLVDNMTPEQYLEICRIAVVNNGNALEYVESANNMSDEQYFEMCKLAVQTNGRALEYVPKKHKTFEMCKLAVKNDGSTLFHIINSREYNEIKPEEYLEICKIAVQTNGRALKYVPDDKKTLEICKIAVYGDGFALTYVPDNKKTLEICKIAVQNDGFSLCFVPEMHKTFEICKIAVENNTIALHYIKPDEITKITDEQYNEIYKLAVNKKGLALDHIPELKRTLEICEIAVQNDGIALVYVPNLNKTFEICKKAIKQNGRALKYIFIEDKTDEEKLELYKLTDEEKLELYKLAVQSIQTVQSIHNEYNPLEYVPSANRTSELCMLAVEHNGLALKHVPGVTNYLDICKKAVEQNGLALQYIHNNNKYLYNRKAVIQNGLALKYVPENQKESNCVQAVKQNGWALQYVPDINKSNDVCEIALKQNGLVLQHIDPALIINITDEEYFDMCKTAIEQNVFALEFVKTVFMKPEQYYEICKIAVTNNSDTLQFVRANKITHEQYYEICELTVTNNGDTLKYVQFYSEETTPEQYYNICKLAVENNGTVLQFVEFFLDYKQYPYKMLAEQYYKICEFAVKNNGLALQYVKANKIEPVQYYKICEFAVKNNGLALQYVKANKIEPEQYYEICEFAVKNNGLALQYVKANKIEPEQYYEICQEALQHLDNLSNEDIYKTCLLAVQNYGTLLYDVNKLKSKITDEQYFEICKQAVQTSYWNTFGIVIADNMTNEQYYEICKLAVQNNGSALKFVKTEKNNDYQNYTICQEALQHLDNLSNENIYKTCLVAVKINGNLLYYVNKLISKFTYEQYNKICEKAIEKNSEASNYIISKEDYNNLLSLTINQSGGANNSYSYNYDEFLKLMKKEREDLEMFFTYEMFLNKIINDYKNNNKIDDFELIVYLALSIGQDPSKVPILFEILKIITLDKDKQTILLSYNKKERKKMLDKYSNKDVLTQIEQKIKYYYDLYKKEVAYIEQRILKLDSEYSKKLLKFDNPEKIKYIIKNLIDDKIKELFDKSNLNNLYSLNLYDLMDYLDKYIKKSSKKSSRIKKSSKNQAKKSSKKKSKKTSKK